MGLPSGTDRPKALLIDDERMLLELYSISFAKGGFDVVTAPSAEKALALLTGGYRPDIILTDITMPEMSGYEFLEKVGQIHLGRCLKITLTNEGQVGETGRMKELGADAHFLKAKYTPSELVDEVKKLYEKR